MSAVFLRYRKVIPGATAIVVQLAFTLVVLVATLWILPSQQVLALWMTVLLVWLARTLNSRRGRPPSPFPLPIIGHTHLFALEDVADAIMRLSKTYGDIVELWVTGRRFVILSHPRQLKQICQSSIYHLRGDIEPCALKELHMNDGIVLNADLDRWSLHKQWFLQGTSSSQVLQQMSIDCLDHAKPLNTIISSQAGSPLNIYNLLCRFYLDITFLSTFGEHLDCLGNPKSPIANPFLEFFYSLRYFTFTPSIIYNYFTKSMTAHHRKVVDDIIGTEMHMINKAATSPAAQDRFLHFMIKQQSADPTITDQQVRSVLHESALGALDTSAVACNILRNLESNPRVVEKLRDEMAEVNPSEAEWTPELLLHLRYCDQVIYETLRLTPASPLTGRMNAEEDTIDGYHIPQYSNIFLSFERVHQDERHWNDPMTFNPERFDNESTENISDMSAKWQFLPFGGGGRMCAGKRVAFVLLKTVLVNIVNNFDFEFRDKDLKRVWEGVLVPVNGEDWVTMKPVPCGA